MMDDDEYGAISGMVDMETEVLGENLLQSSFVHHKSHMTDLDSKPAANRLSYSRPLVEFRIPSFPSEQR
jgi:hypothetical protein